MLEGNELDEPMTLTVVTRHAARDMMERGESEKKSWIGTVDDASCVRRTGIPGNILYVVEWKKDFCRIKQHWPVILRKSVGAGLACRDLSRAKSSLLHYKSAVQYGNWCARNPVCFLLELPQDDLIWEQGAKWWR
ncbi:hypothetical protein KCP73_12040 [Salmonella enterica subsp. enterica]|nr:hypothetical protein KCP73_12040 [Salmonella enterica subsp. enterica]